MTDRPTPQPSTPSPEWEAKLLPEHSGYDDPAIVAHAFPFGDGVWSNPARRLPLAVCGWADRSAPIVNDNPTMPVPHCPECERRLRADSPSPEGAEPRTGDDVIVNRRLGHVKGIDRDKGLILIEWSDNETEEWYRPDAATRFFRLDAEREAALPEPPATERTIWRLIESYGGGIEIDNVQRFREHVRAALPEPPLDVDPELKQLRRIALAAGRVSDAAISSKDVKAAEGTRLMMALGELDAELGKPLRRLGTGETE